MPAVLSTASGADIFRCRDETRPQIELIFTSMMMLQGIYFSYSDENVFLFVLEQIKGSMHSNHALTER